MERERNHENDRRRTLDDAPSGSGDLEHEHAEIDELLRASDDAFDAINNLHAQQYLQQNLQTGGQ